MHFEISSAICFNLDLSKILLSGNGLTIHQTTNSLTSPNPKQVLVTNLEVRHGKKEKMLVISIFSFFHDVFKRLLGVLKSQEAITL